MLTTPSDELTGKCLIDDEILAAHGVTDFSNYRSCDSEDDLELDFWMRRPTSDVH